MNISALSGDSTVKSFSFDGENLTFEYEDDELDETFHVCVKTDRVFSESVAGEGCVHIRLESFANYLVVEEISGIYTMPAEFHLQMVAIRTGYHLGLGLKSEEFESLFLVVGSGIICACPIRGESDINVESV